MSPDQARTDLIKKIMAGEIAAYSEARQYLKTSVADATAARQILADIFPLIKKINWGFFSDLSLDKFPKLWHELVITDESAREFGDLKQYMTLSQVYASILDIHGYTTFCQENKVNITMLQRLDNFISIRIAQCASAFGVLARREMGDSVILVGAEVSAILAATFEIIQLFSKEGVIKGGSGVKADFFLPAFKISAGIAGGQPQTPLIISENGTLAGSLINTAARLQSRANAMAPNQTKVITDQYVLLNFEKLNYKQGILDKIQFFFNGEVSFKGITMKNFEAYLYTPADHYKTKIQEDLNTLQEAIRENQWQTKVMTSLCDLACATAKAMPPFFQSVTVDRQAVNLNNQIVDAEFRELKNLMTATGDYQGAVEKLGFLCRALEQCAPFDRVVLEYCVNIHKTYQVPLRNYIDLFQDHLQDKNAQVFTPEEAKIFQIRKQVENAYQSLMKRLRQGDHLKDKRRIFWLNAVQNTKKDMDFKIYSGKK